MIEGMTIDKRGSNKMKLNESLFEDYYSDSDNFDYKIKQDIDDKVNDIFVEYQRMLGIESGDISPEHSMELETKEEELSDLIKEILYSQLNYYPDKTPYGESLNGSEFLNQQKRVPRINEI